MKKVIILRTADGIMSDPEMVDTNTRQIQRLCRSNLKLDDNLHPVANQKVRIRTYRFEGERCYPNKFYLGVEIFDEVL